jgi:hypothetical protein
MSGFDKGQVKSFVKQAKAEAGDGWSMLGPRIQRALIAERALAVIRGQASETILVDTANDLLVAMMKEAGLDE